METDFNGPSQETVNSYSLQDESENHLWSKQCEGVWHRLKDVQAEVQSLPAIRMNEAMGQDQNNSELSQSQLYTSLTQYEKRLKAELFYLQEKRSEEFSVPNKEVQYLILQQDQLTQKQHLKETLIHVKAKHSSLTECIAQEEEMNHLLTKVRDSLKAKLANRPDQTDQESEPSINEANADLKTKVNKLKQTNKHFQNNLKELLSSFPSPSGEEKRWKKSKKALDTTNDFDEENFLSLSSILGRLMEQTLNHPAQPYIDIGQDMWPPHIELLLKSQIVLKDPESSMRMKLIPFHL